MLKINNIKITGIGPIKYLELSFDNHFNIICGQNGIGKTTILDCLAQSFSLSTTSLTRRADFKAGNWLVEVFINNRLISKSVNISSFEPHERNFVGQGFYQNSNEVIVFKTLRDISYKKLSTLATDTLKRDINFASETLSGSLPDDLKNWFVNRFLFSAQPDALDENQLKNHQLARDCFSILNPAISFNKVVPNTFDILLNAPSGVIYFEYLSSGYKSCLAVLLGLIMEIELRFRNPSKYIKDFEGIVFIDELDLHLHPEWQAKIYEALKMLLPKAQIFTSTHSPHIIQIAQPNEIIPLTLDSTEEIQFNSVINKEFGCQGWTVEEILNDVMGMSETRTETYLEAINKFNLALDNESFQEAKQCFEILDKMLHPENSLRKILKIQLSGLPEND